MSPIDLNLTEWQSMSPDPGSRTEGVTLGADPSVRDLARSLTERGILEVQELRTGLALRATSFVGRVRLGEIEVTVVPKLPSGALLTLLRYAYGLRHLHLLPTTTGVMQELGFQDILVWQLVEEAQRLLARGLRRAYVRREEALASPRGRIDFQAMAARHTPVEATLPCVHHRRDEDRLINRVLLAGVRLAASVVRDRRVRLRANRLADLLVESISLVQLDRQVLRRLEGEMDRTTRAYEPAVSLIRILHEGGGLSLDGGEIGPSLPGFFFDMNRFFQALLTRFLAESLPDHTVRSEYRLRGMLGYVPGWNPCRRQPPTPRPDFVVMQGSKTVAILDAKYRDLWENPLPRDMLYQLALYAMSHEGGTSTILYPTIHPQATEARIEVRDPLNGGRRALVALRPVVLDRLEGLVTARPTAVVLRERRSFARELAFGTKPLRPGHLT
jgi:5-methylcytosine-specific restriction enzyme subunit McrC